MLELAGIKTLNHLLYEVSSVESSAEQNCDTARNPRQIYLLTKHFLHEDMNIENPEHYHAINEYAHRLK